MENFDVIIVGSGIVGATAALALTKNTSLNIAIIDSQPISASWQDQHYDHRVSAISLASKRIFQNLHVWDKILAKRISPYTRMHVWQEQSTAKIDFDCADVNESVLGYILEDSAMRSSLYDAFSGYENLHLFSSKKLVSLTEKPECIELLAADNQSFSTKLLIAADGANSWVRDQVRIDLKTHPYGHTAIVATVKTALPHQTTAWQRFLTTGPLAFLPLKDANTSSIVWSTTQPDELLSLNDAEFKQKLTEAFAEKLGHVVDVEKRYHFPLQMRHAQQYVKSRIALIGDAAHTIHPLAGQGVNLGMLDAACLTEVVIDAFNKERDYASFATLRCYERWRKGDNLAMLKGVEILKHLFASEKKLLQNLRDVGLNFADQFSMLKNFFANYALGNRGDLPKLVD